MQIITRNGGTRDGNTLEDGERIKVSLLMADAAIRSAKRPLVVDAFGGTAGLHRPGARYAPPAPAHSELRAAEDTLRIVRDVAFADAEEEATSAWRRPPGAFPLSAGEGTKCTIHGPGGTLGRGGESVVCRASAQAQPTRTDAQPPMVEDKEAVWRAANLADENAWRVGK